MNSLKKDSKENLIKKICFLEASLQTFCVVSTHITAMEFDDVKKEIDKQVVATYEKVMDEEPYAKGDKR